METNAIIGRLEELLAFYGLSAAAFADKVQVQRSSVSHLLTGRNKPSLEFVLKVVNSFSEVTLDWLLSGKGAFPTEAAEPKPTAKSAPLKTDVGLTRTQSKKKLIQIVLLFDDGSFETFNKGQ